MKAKNHKKRKEKEKKRECEREGKRKREEEKEKEKEKEEKKEERKKNGERAVLKVFSSTPPPPDTFLTTIPSLGMAREQHNFHRGGTREKHNSYKW